MAWEKLPPDTTETCDRNGNGFKRYRAGADNSGRCGKPAIIIDRKTCNCGQHDMSWRFCSECYFDWNTNQDEPFLYKYPVN